MKGRIVAACRRTTPPCARNSVTRVAVEVFDSYPANGSIHWECGIQLFFTNDCSNLT